MTKLLRIVSLDKCKANLEAVGFHLKFNFKTIQTRGISNKHNVLNELCEIKKKTFGPLLCAESGAVFRKIFETRTFIAPFEISAWFIFTTRVAVTFIDVSAAS